MSKRGYQDWLDSLPPDESDDYPHQDDPTDEDYRALAAEMPVSLPPTDAELDAMARQFDDAGAMHPEDATPSENRP